MAQYRRSIFLIDKPFQLRFSFYVCSWLFALSIVYPLIIYNLFNYFVRYMSLDPTGPSLTGIEQVRQEIVWLLVLFQAIFMVVTFLISIFVSHRIAGPLYKLRKYLAQAKEGKIDGDMYFRKKDHFQDLAAEYNQTMAGLRAKFEASRQALDSAIAELERSNSSDSVLSRLRQARDQIPQ